MSQDISNIAAKINKNVLLIAASHLQEVHDHFSKEIDSDMSTDFLAGFQWGINELKNMANRSPKQD